MTLQKIKHIRQLILISVYVVIAVIVLGFVMDSCGFRHMEIVIEQRSYEKSLDPEVCDVLIEKIDLFNLDCIPEVEILDCG